MPKAPLEIGFRISKSSMEGARPVLDEGLAGLLEGKRLEVGTREKFQASIKQNFMPPEIVEDAVSLIVA